jgi:hypothetical protein
LAKCRDQVDAGLVFIADDLGAWLVAALAEAGRNRLVTWAQASEQERARELGGRVLKVAELRPADR